MSAITATTPSLSSKKSVQKRFSSGALLTALGIFTVVVFQFVVFRYHYERCLANYYPNNYDQIATYKFAYDSNLALSHRLGLPSEKVNIDPAIRLDVKPHGAPNSIYVSGTMIMKGAFVPLVTLLSTELFGVSRWSVALVNFSYLVMGELAIFFGMQALYGARAAIIGCGMYLLSTTHYYIYGGLDDARLDYPGLVMMGVTFLLALNYLETGNRKSLVWTVASLILSTMTRSVLLIYWLATAVAGIGSLTLTSLWIKTQAFQKYRRRATAIGIAAAVILLLYIGLTWHDFAAYYVNCKTSGEDAMRRRENGVTDLATFVLFYPESFLVHFSTLLTTLFAACFIPHLFLMVREDWQPKFREPVAGPLLFSTCLMASVFICVNVYVPSPLVIGVLTIPLSVVSALLINKLNCETFGKLVTAAVATVILGTGLLYYQKSLMHNRPDNEVQKSAQVFKTLDTVGKLVTRRNQQPTCIMWAIQDDGVNHDMFEIRWREKQGQMLTPIKHITLNAYPAYRWTNFLSRLKEADILVIPTKMPPASKTQFEYDGLAALRRDLPTIKSLVSRDFTPVETTELTPQDQVTVFEKRMGSAPPNALRTD